MDKHRPKLLLILLFFAFYLYNFIYVSCIYNFRCLWITYSNIELICIIMKLAT